MTCKSKLLLVVLSVLQGCASTAPPKSKAAIIAPNDMAAIHGKPVFIKAAPTPDFMRATGTDQATMTIGAMFGAVGGGIGAAAAIAHMKSAGHALVVENAIPDPIGRLTEGVETLLASKYGSATDASQYEIDIAVLRWALAKDDVVFSASVRVMDEAAKPPKLLALGECNFNTVSQTTKATAEELLANRAEKLKQTLDDAADRCVKILDENVFL